MGLNDGISYQASEWGAKFHSLPHNEALGAGAAGPGKSFVLLMDPMYQIQVEHERCANPKHPYHQAWGKSTGKALFLRRIHQTLTETIERAQTIFPELDPGVKWERQSSTFTFSSGYKYIFGHCKDPDSWQQYHSQQYTWIGFDELTQFMKRQYDQIRSRLRSSDPVLRPMRKVRAMSNPVMQYEAEETFAVDEDPHWVRKRFVDPWPTGNKTLKKKVKVRDGYRWHRRIYLPATLYDNPDPEFVAEYEFELAEKPQLIRQALLYGNWYVTAGSFYGEVWNQQLHVIKPFRVPDDWKQFRSMDWGYKAHGVVGWWAIDPDDNLYLLREYTFQKKTVDQVAKRIREIEEVHGLWGRKRSLITGPADTQLWEERGDTGKPKIRSFLEAGVPWVPADKKSRVANAQRLLMRLQDHGSGTQNPGIMFVGPYCPETIKTLPAIQTTRGYVEEPQDGGDDHWHDMVLYACAFASRGRAGVPAMRDDYENEDELEEKKDRRPQGRYAGYGSMYI